MEIITRFLETSLGCEDDEVDIAEFVGLAASKRAEQHKTDKRRNRGDVRESRDVGAIDRALLRSAPVNR